MTEEELARHGGNKSHVHVGFMIGSAELNIDGLTVVESFLCREKGNYRLKIREETLLADVIQEHARRSIAFHATDHL